MKKHDLAIKVLFFWFVFQTLFFVLFVGPGVPDSGRHFFISNIYYTSPMHFPFEDKPDYYKKLTETPATPYFYHLMMGWLLHLDVFKLDQKLFLRLVNVVLGFITLFFSLKFIREISDDYFVHFCFLAILTNTLMFVFLYSGVSYDNLVNLCSMASFFYFVKYLKNHDRKDLLALTLFCSVGTLTKISFLPLIFIFLILLALQSKEILIDREKLLSKLKFAEVLLLTFCLVFVSLNIRHYVGNIVDYGSIVPSKAEVRGEENTLDALSQRDRELVKTVHEREAMPFPIYLAKWLSLSIRGIIGIVSHQSLVHSKSVLITVVPLFVFAFLIFLIRSKEWIRNKIDAYLFLICVFYSIVVFYYNYSSYLTHHAFGVALQGRYLFPIYFVLIALLVKYGLWRLKPLMKFFICALTTTFFTSMGFIYFLTKAPDFWYQTPW